MIPKKIYLGPEYWNRLSSKAEALGFVGKGKFSRLFEKIATEDVVFLDSNAKKLLEVYFKAINNKKS